MSQPDLRKLDTGDQLPPISLPLLGGGTIDLPAQRWTMLLIYRGNW
ncbi:MAG: hypothetical protein AAGD14_18070 [Planctomycetota bacterium]